MSGHAIEATVPL